MWDNRLMAVRKKRKNINLIAIGFFIASALFYLISEKYPLAGKQAGDDFVPVMEVHDGDTVSVTMDTRTEKIRLIGIDAPEMGQKPWGSAAKSYLENLLSSSGWRVRIELDVDKRDTYGRRLAYLWTARGEMINVLMIKGGYAMLYTHAPNVKHVDELAAAQREARGARMGIWGEGGLKKRPGDYRKEHPRI
ncbi:MAG: thermonuclease family protein [Nitrospirota bacterium]